MTQSTLRRSWRATCAAWLYYRVAIFIVQREGKAINKYFASIYFFQTIHAGNASSGPWFTNNQCGKTIVHGTMDAGINNVIYMELNSGPKIANSTCGKTIVAGTIDRGSTVLPSITSPSTSWTLGPWVLIYVGMKVCQHFLSVYVVLCRLGSCNGLTLLKAVLLKYLQIRRPWATLAHSIIQKGISWNLLKYDMN